MTQLELKEVSKTFDSVKTVLNSISFSIEPGEFVVLVGPSGSGKSTILDMICGFEHPTAGEIKIEGTLVNERAPNERDVAMVFQNYALLPHLTVFDNIGFGMKIRKEKKAIIKEKVRWACGMLQLTDVMCRYPKELSGGQRQRVALARAMVRKPKLFLMDEPLSNLDMALRDEASRGIKNLHEELGTSILYVTHSQEEALTLADRIIVLNQGEVQQIGTPEELYQNPQNEFVASFIGNGHLTLLPVMCEKGKLVTTQNTIGNVFYPPIYEGKVVSLGLRSEHLQLQESQRKDYTIVDIDYLGKQSLYTIENSDGYLFKVEENSSKVFTKGSHVAIAFHLEKAFLFDKITKKRIEITDGN